MQNVGLLLSPKFCVWRFLKKGGDPNVDGLVMISQQAVHSSSVTVRFAGPVSSATIGIATTPSTSEILAAHEGNGRVLRGPGDKVAVDVSFWCATVADGQVVYRCNGKVLATSVWPADELEGVVTFSRDGLELELTSGCTAEVEMDKEDERYFAVVIFEREPVSVEPCWTIVR